MRGPRCTSPAALERAVAIMLATSAELMGVMRECVMLPTSPASRRAWLATVRTTLRLADLVERRPAVNPDDARPETVRADAALRSLAHALREQAEALVTDLTRQLRARRPRRDTA
jgi:hypothetical protein